MLKRLLLVINIFVCASCFGVAQQIDFLAAGLTDVNGNPLTSGKVYTYSAGTLASKSTYLDARGAGLQSNPIILDALGRALAFGDGRYKFVVKDASGTVLYTWDGLTYKANLAFSTSYVTTSVAGQASLSISISDPITVYINGIKQASGTYTWNPPLLVFDEPLLASWTIEVMGN